MPHYIPSETVRCVHCGHMPWEKLNPNAPEETP